MYLFCSKVGNRDSWCTFRCHIRSHIIAILKIIYLITKPENIPKDYFVKSWCFTYVLNTIYIIETNWWWESARFVTSYGLLVCFHPAVVYTCWLSMYVWTRGRLISANGLTQPPLSRSKYAIMSIYCSHTAVTCQSWRQILLMWHSIHIRWLTFVLWENGNDEKDEI